MRAVLAKSHGICSTEKSNEHSYKQQQQGRAASVNVSPTPALLRFLHPFTTRTSTACTLCSRETRHSHDHATHPIRREAEEDDHGYTGGQSDPHHTQLHGNHNVVKVSFDVHLAVVLPAGVALKLQQDDLRTGMGRHSPSGGHCRRGRVLGGGGGDDEGQYSGTFVQTATMEALSSST